MQTTFKDIRRPTFPLKAVAVGEWGRILTGWKNILAREGRLSSLHNLLNKTRLCPRSSHFTQSSQVMLQKKPVWTDDQGISLLLCLFHKTTRLGFGLKLEFKIEIEENIGTEVRNSEILLFLEIWLHGVHQTSIGIAFSLGQCDS